MFTGKVTGLLLMSAAHSSLASAGSLHNSDNSAIRDIRALSDSPSGNYAPQNVTCPSPRPTIRSAGSGLSQSEQDFLAKRRAATVQPMKEFMTRANIKDFDAESYLNDQANNVANLPNIAIAMSGGGYRALMNGAGFVAATDSNTNGSTGAGGIGGLLQSTTYLAGLSGGAWLVGSLYSNNFSSVQDLMGSSDIWQFQDSIFTGPGSGGLFSTVEYWTSVHSQVGDKSDAGYNTSITDYWGRALSYQLINAPDGGPAYTWSSIAQDQNLIDGNIPMPIIVADGRDPGATIISINATNYELNPWEIGTFDPTVYGFVPTRYVGSNFSAGSVLDNGNCVEGFDQAGFVMGTSSSLFNQFLLTNISAVADIPSFIVDAITSVLTDLGQDNNDIAQWMPNPFFGFNPSTNPIANTNQLSLVDGGEDLQNIPLNPLLQPIRAVDVIYAVDSSADTDTNWPNGTALRATYERSLVPEIANGTLFPAIPDANTFINLGLNNRPTFFGCDASNFTLAEGQSPPPLIVYMPNSPYMTFSNVTTFTPSYNTSQRNDIIMNGRNNAIQSNESSESSEWPACVACAALSRSLARTGTAVPSGCSACFERYCWNGTLDQAEVSGYSPGLDSGGAGSDSDSAGVKIGAQGLWLSLMAAVVTVLVQM
ncbi:unnamed protein product [Discula destructiva]